MQDIPITFSKAVCLSVQNVKAFYCPCNSAYLQFVEEQPGIKTSTGNVSLIKKKGLQNFFFFLTNKRIFLFASILKKGEL